MTANLDLALEPDETIAFRTRGRTITSAAIYYGTVFLAVVLFVYLYRNLPGQVPIDGADPLLIFVVVSSAIAALALSVMSMWGQGRNPDDLIVTNGRLLFANADWDNKVESLGLDQIIGVKWAIERGLRHVIVQGREAEIRLTHLRDISAAAKAIAETAGVPSPPALGRVAIVDLAQLGMLPAMFAVGLGLLYVVDVMHLTAPGGALHFGVWWSRLVVFSSMGVFAYLLGMLIGIPLTVTAMRPFMTAEQVQATVCAGKTEKWHTWFALRWASLLYRRPLSHLVC